MPYTLHVGSNGFANPADPSPHGKNQWTCASRPAHRLSALSSLGRGVRSPMGYQQVSMDDRDSHDDDHAQYKKAWVGKIFFIFQIQFNCHFIACHFWGKLHTWTTGSISAFNIGFSLSLIKRTFQKRTALPSPNLTSVFKFPSNTTRLCSSIRLTD